MTTKSSLRVWYRALRPFTYSASLVPVLVGSAIAWREGHVDVILFLFALLGSVFIQIGTNLANEYFDYVQGVDKTDSLGPAGVIIQGKLPARQVLVAAVLAFTTGATLGIYIVIKVGIVILLVGLLSVLFAWFYTAKPISLGYRGLGEAEVFIFMGPVMVAAAYYVQARTIYMDTTPHLAARSLSRDGYPACQQPARYTAGYGAGAVNVGRVGL